MGSKVIVDDISNADGLKPTVGGKEVNLRDEANGIGKIKDGDYTATSGDVIMCDTLTNGAFTITLPESPSDFDWVKVIDYKANFDDDNLTVARNGSSIMGADEDLVIDTENASVTLSAIDGDWRIV